MSIAKEFILAAERHKVVCEKLLNMPELANLKKSEDNSSSSIITSPQQRQILSDIYYLSGYIIECSCTAAIYSHYPKLHHKDNLNPLAEDKDRKLRNVKFKTNEPTVFSVCGKGDHSLSHFTKYPNFFANPNIPLLDGNDAIFTSKNCYPLYDCFYAEIRYGLKPDEAKIPRYANPIIIHYENVNNFFEIGKEIFTSVRKTFKI